MGKDSSYEDFNINSSFNCLLLSIMVEYMHFKSSSKDHIKFKITIKDINCINVKSVVIAYINCFINFIMPNRQDCQIQFY